MDELRKLPGLKNRDIRVLPLLGDQLVFSTGETAERLLSRQVSAPVGDALSAETMLVFKATVDDVRVRLSASTHAGQLRVALRVEGERGEAMWRELESSRDFDYGRLRPWLGTKLVNRLQATLAGPPTRLRTRPDLVAEWTLDFSAQDVIRALVSKQAQKERSRQCVAAMGFWTGVYEEMPNSLVSQMKLDALKSTKDCATAKAALDAIHGASAPRSLHRQWKAAQHLAAADAAAAHLLAAIPSEAERTRLVGRLLEAFEKASKSSSIEPRLEAYKAMTTRMVSGAESAGVSNAARVFTVQASAAQKKFRKVWRECGEALEDCAANAKELQKIIKSFLLLGPYVADSPKKAEAVMTCMVAAEPLKAMTCFEHFRP